MTFTSQTLFPGDLFESAARFAEDADKKLAPIAEPSARAQARATIWREAAALGWSGVLIEEELGGVGGGLLELAAVLEGCGRFALPVPVLAAFGVGPLLIAALGGKRKSELLNSIAAATTVVCPVLDPLDISKPRSRSDTGLSAKVEGDRVLLDGEVRGVETVPGATHYLIACSIERSGTSAPALCLIPAASKGISVRDRIRMDGRASADLRFSAVAVGMPDMLATGEAVRAALGEVRDKAALLAGVETVAAMGALLEQTIAYLSERKQFGATLSSFQVLRHYVADMYVAYENLRALLNSVLRKVAAEPASAWEEVALAKLRLSDVARFFAHSAIQLHGGMGVTEELQATRLAKRILMSDFEYGDGAFHAERLLGARAA